MARRTIRVEIPTGKPDDLIALAKNVRTKHVADGADSPLDTDMMTTLNTKTTSAETKNASAKQHDAQAQALRQDRDTSLGLADGQTADSPDTVLNLLTYTRDALLLKFRGNEEKLSEYGFNVVVGSAKSPTKKPKTP